MIHVIYQCFLQAVNSINTRASRSLITALGIVVSVASIITVVSIIQGMSYSIMRNFEGLGANVLTVQSDTPFEQRLLGELNRLTMEDYLSIKRNFGFSGQIIPSFSPFGQFGAMISSGGQESQTRVIAVTSSYKDAIEVYPDKGRFITNSDNASARKVAIIGERVRKNLKLPANPIGEFIDVGGTTLKVVGVMEERGDILGLSQDDYIVVPFTIGQRMLADEGLQDITVLINLENIANTRSVQLGIEELLRESRGLREDEDDDFMVQTAQQLTRSISSVTDTITVVLGGIVGISLIVSGIGIMNTMLMSVTERTREIGICKALGFQRHVILLQFLIEAVIVSFLGGLIGLFVGWLLGYLAVLFIPGLPAPIIPNWAVALALFFSSFIGLLFGVVPAAKASDLDPITALRYE
ncbi:ABC transporter permease [Alteromonas sp. KUL17]|uniref:ABC transporter permease n=1 Tax=Alteromonas sp. KUL17 TaxID=2480796 RepID=UPI001037EB2C|nr:ABC transporter permease [Alteromonas sp. KUL17]TAP29217.1 FtsX-like permease family protein [Alteromonas sp. KUL17]GEA02590.1 ABC transporter permease [Alteromonas sp. KUL17]